MAAAGALPAPLARVTPGTGVPAASIALATVVAIGFACFGRLTVIAGVTDFAVYVVFLAVNATVIVLRRRAPDAARPFRAPGVVRGMPVVPLAASVVTLAMLPQLDPGSLSVGVVLLVAGVVAYAMFDR
jgi:APA family basic amino acid/polyamine antiporter